MGATHSISFVSSTRISSISLTEWIPQINAGESDSADAGNQTVGNVAVDNPDGDVLAGNTTDSKLQTLPPTGEIIAAAGLGGIALALAAYDIRN